MQLCWATKLLKLCFFLFVILSFLEAQVTADSSTKGSSSYYSSSTSSSQKPRESPLDLPGVLWKVLSSLQESLERIVGKEVMRQGAEFLSRMGQMVAEGLTVALKHISKVIGELLSALGLDGEKFVQYLTVTPDQMYTILTWAVVALIAYWVLFFVLGLLFSFVMRIFWWLKILLFLSIFLYIMIAVEEPTQRATMLLALVVCYILLGKLFFPSSTSTAQVEGKVRNLQGQIDEIHWKLSRATQHRRADLKEDYE